jgi:hypothetical protein
MLFSVQAMIVVLLLMMRQVFILDYHLEITCLRSIWPALRELLDLTAWMSQNLKGLFCSKGRNILLAIK